MSADSFSHDAARFEVSAPHGGVTLSDVEARYAELYADVIWDGIITPDKRQRLTTAAQMFGVDAERARHIEEALRAAHEVRHTTTVVEQQVASERDGGDEEISPRAPESIMPLAPSDDPPIQALQGRIAALDQRVSELEGDNAALSDVNHQLEELVEQLQTALSSTLEELDQTGTKLAGAEAQLDSARQQLRMSQARDRAAPGGEPRVTPIGEAAGSAAQKGDQPTEQAPLAAPSRIKARRRSRRLLRAVDPAAESAAQRRDDPQRLHEALADRPRDGEVLRQLFGALGRREDLDRRWCVAHAMVYLGVAGEAERRLYQQHLAPGLVRPQRAVNEDEWHELLFHPAEGTLTGRILATIAPSVLLGHLTAIRASIAPELLDPAARVEPRRSTVQAVRCIKWAATSLGLSTPPIYACPEYPGTADIVLNPTPCTRLGQAALVGRSSHELAFLAGQHLCWYRREHLLGRPTRSVRRLEDSFLAALMIGNPGLPLSDEIKKRVTPVAKTIRPLLDEQALEILAELFARFVELGGRTNLSRWYAAVEHTAARTGLLLANDLRAAEAMLELERAVTPPRRPGAAEGPGVEPIMDELIVFFTSRACSTLRRRIGVAFEGH